MFDFRSFFDGLTKEQQAAFAQSAGTSVEYIDLFLKRGRRMPRPELLGRLCAAIKPFHAPVTHAELLAFFYDASSRRTAEQVAA